MSCRATTAADWEGIEKNEITDAIRIKFAREILTRECMNPDTDTIWGLYGAEITSSDGQSAWAVFTIPPLLSGLDIEFFGIFADLEALTERMRKDGYVNVDKIGNADDTVAWITDEQILKLWSRSMKNEE